MNLKRDGSATFYNPINFKQIVSTDEPVVQYNLYLNRKKSLTTTTLLL